MSWWVFIVVGYAVGFVVQPADAQLVYDASIYSYVIEAVHTIFNNTCVIFMYTRDRPMQSLDLLEAEQLMSIPKYIARLHVRTFAYAIKTFKKIIGESYVTLKRPLFVIINDSEEMKETYAKEIAPWIDMAYINWVIFFGENTKIEDFFADIFVPLDCVFLIVQKIKDTDTFTLTEVYSIAKGGELIIKEFGSWSEQDGLSITRLALYQRRGDLQGQLIRVSTVKDPPVSLIEIDAEGKMTGIKGFFGTVIQLLIENMNCTVTYSESKIWGSRKSNGDWSGVVGMLVRNETDLAAAELMMTGDRLEAIEFTTPVFSTKCRAFIKRPNFAAIKWTAYSDPFYAGIWLSLIIVMITSSALILIGFKKSPKRIYCRKEDIESSFADTFFQTFGAICAQGHDTIMIDPIRIIHLVIHLTGVIILAAYSAALISFLAIKEFVMPFTSMEGLLMDGSYKFGVVRDSSDYSFFQNSSDKILERMFNEILDDPYNLPDNYMEGLNMVCTKNNYAFMTMDNMFAILQHQIPCHLEPLDTIMQTTMAMAVPRRSPFRGIINSNILLMRDSGVLQRVIATELLTGSLKTMDHWTSVEMVDVLPLILLILAGVGTGLAALFCEKLYHSKFRKQAQSALQKTLHIDLHHHHHQHHDQEYHKKKSSK